mgnify:CR=1 FL=1
MRSYSLYDKVLELYANNPEPDKDTVKRTVRNFLKRKYPDRKIDRILETLVSEDTLRQEALHARNVNNLRNFAESIIESRIRDSAKTGVPIDIDELDEINFKALIKFIILSYNYELLYTTPLFANSLDFIAHRNNVKVAVYALKTDPAARINARIVRQARYIANLYNCDSVIIVTNGFFDNEALTAGEDIGITLLDKSRILPLLNNIIQTSRKEQKELLTLQNGGIRNEIYMEKVIRFPKTKVQIIDIRYSITDERHLVFWGKLVNTGKKPVLNLEINVKLFNRQGDCVYVKNVTVREGLLMSKEETDFSFTFSEIPESEFKSLCRYELTLNYKNIYRNNLFV